ncbi:MAG: GAF domain-containing protein [Nitrospinae bacterium]|nr:GAF domain-containing protein [Nitrospinota bacterium]
MNSFDILTQLVELTSNATNAFTAALYGFDPEKKLLSLRAHITLSGHFDKDAAFPIGKGPIGQVARSREPLLVERCEDEIGKLKFYRKKEELKGYLIVPAIYDDLEGVLAVDSKEIYTFSPKLQKIVAGFAEQMAWHLHREKQSQSWRREEVFPYHDMIRYSRSLMESPDAPAIAEQLTRIPPSILNCDAVATIWVEPDGSLGKVVRHRGWDVNLTDLDIVPGKGIAGSCAKNMVPILIEDTEKRKTVLFSENENLEAFKSRLAVPILWNNQALGAIVCAARKPQALTHSHLDRLSLVASYAATALTCASTRRQSAREKNLDPITGIPNHRFLADYRRAIENEILNNRHSVFSLMVRINNLPSLYETFGVEIGDNLLRQMVSMLSHAVPSPKHIFKYSDAAFLVLLMQIKREEASHLETRLKLAFDENPIFVDGKPVPVAAELGLSSFPEDGKNLGELIGASWARIPQNVKAER